MKILGTILLVVICLGSIVLMIYSLKNLIVSIKEKKKSNVDSIDVSKKDTEKKKDKKGDWYDLVI